jgi:hypothetical protein
MPRTKEKVTNPLILLDLATLNAVWSVVINALSPPRLQVEVRKGVFGNTYH